MIDRASSAAPLAVAALLAGVAGAPAGAAASAVAAAAAVPMTPAQALDYRRIGDLRLSPDGSRLAFVVLSYPQDYSPHVWLIELATRAARELTPAGKSERSPEWAPDGRELAVLSNRGGGKAQVLLLSPDGAAPVQLTSRRYGVTAFRWSSDGHSIAYLARDDAAPDEDHGAQIADDARQLPRLWMADVASRSSRPLGGAAEVRYRVDEFEWQDGTHLLAVATATPRVEEFDSAVYQVATGDGRFTAVSHPPQPFNGLAVSADGAHYAVRSTRAHGPLERDVFIGTIGRDDLHAAAGLPDLAVGYLRWPQPERLWLSLVDGFYRRLYRYAPGTRAAEIRVPLSVLGTFDVARDGRIAFVGGDFGHLDEIYLREADGRLRQLSHLQSPASGIHLAPTSIFRTASFDGTPIEAALMQPETMAPGGKWPLVLLVHGGPASSFAAGYGWESAWAQLLTSHGYEVLLVNPRGSNGYSEAFLAANRGDWGGGDYRDLMAVLDAVIARGRTDPERPRHRRLVLWRGDVGVGDHADPALQGRGCRGRSVRSGRGVRDGARPCGRRVVFRHPLGAARGVRTQFTLDLHPQRAHADPDPRRGGRSQQPGGTVAGAVSRAEALRRRHRARSLPRRGALAAQLVEQPRHVHEDPRVVRPPPQCGAAGPTPCLRNTSTKRSVLPSIGPR